MALAALFAPSLAIAFGWRNVIGLAVLPLLVALIVYLLMAKNSPDNPPPKPVAQQLVEALQGGSASLELLGWPAGVRELVAALRSLPLGTPLLVGPAWVEIH